MSEQLNWSEQSNLVEIIVPVYNVAETLSRCIESILVQTHRAFRLWLVDDGSTDNCPSICDRYAEIDSRIVVIHKDNNGQASARNAALDRVFEIPEVSRGKWVAFVDSDDWVEPDYIDFLITIASKTRAAIVQCGHWISYTDHREIVQPGGTEISVLSKKEAIESVLRNGLWDVTVWNKLFEINIFAGLRFPEGIYYEDTAIAPRFSERAPFVAVCMQPKYHYVQRYDSTANGIGWTNHKLDFLAVGDEVAAYSLRLYPDLEAAALEKRVFVRLSTLAQMVNTRHYDREWIRKMRGFVANHATRILTDPKASNRDKFGTFLIIPGFWLFHFVWRFYYAVSRRR